MKQSNNISGKSDAAGISVPAVDGSSRERPLLWWKRLKFVMISALILFILFIFSSFFPMKTATVRLTPLSQTLSGFLPINVAARQLFSTQQGSQTAVSTGQPKLGTHATGILTFENSTFSWITIPGGTAVTNVAGEVIVTDRDLNVPPDPAIPGVASVTAHAIRIGNSGNIQAMSINKVCCFAGIFVLNKSAFSGGRDTQTIPTIQQSDIDHTVKLLETLLTQKVLSDMRTHLTLGERLLYATPQCSPKITSVPNVNESATNFTINASLACSELAYNPQTVPPQAEDWLKQKAIQQLGREFVLVGIIKTAIESAKADENGNVNVLVLAKGTWKYQFTVASKLKMAKYIVRKTKGDARLWLLQQVGVADVSISVPGPILDWREKDILPNDFKVITLTT